MRPRYIDPRCVRLLAWACLWALTSLPVAAGAAARGACMQMAAERPVVIPELPAGGVVLAGIPAGANAMYNLENDDYWARGTAQKSLQAAGMRSLRYPGGELSDNYDWRRNRLVASARWPGEPAGENLDGRTDYLEFLARARSMGIANIYFVVNVDSAFREPGERGDALRRYARKAGDWVRAVKDAGYSVPYWEIGNEPHLAPGFPLSVSEYAEAVNLYAREMRAADPTIRIGAAGPLYPDGTAFADRLTKEQLAYFRKSGGKDKVCADESTVSDCVGEIKRKVPGKSRRLRWWPDLVRLAGGSFDFIVVHRYQTVQVGAASREQFVELTGSLRKLADAVSRHAGRPVPVAVTEWNSEIEPGRDGKARDAHGLDIAIQYGNLLAAGVAHAHYWPTQSVAKRRFSLLDATGNPLLPVQMFALYGGVRAGDNIAHAAPRTNLYVLRYGRKEGAGYLLVNTDALPLRVQLPAANADEAIVDGVVTAAGGAANDFPACTVAKNGDGILVPLPARSVIRVQQFREK